MSESLKRKRGAQDFVPVSNGAPNGKPTRICSTGKDAKAAIESGSKDAIVALEKQIRVPYSQTASIGLTHPSVVLMQQYLALSPKCEEILTNWKHGNDRKNTQLVEVSIQLLTTMINLLVSVPYFRPTLQNIVEKFLDASENYGNMLTRMILSSKREHAHLGIGLAAALVHVDVGHKGAVSRMNGRLWTLIADSGCLRALPKLLSMRRKGGFAARADPLDKPDIRHLTLHFMLPFLSYTLFLSGSKPMVIPLFANLKDDPALTVFRVLDAIWDAINVSPSAAVNRKASVALLHENSIDGIIKLYKRDGSDDEDDKVNEVTPAEMAHQFLLKTCTKPGVGVCFQDQGWYRRKGKGKADDLTQVEVELDEGEDRGTGKDGGTYGTKMLHNHILGNVVRRVGPRAVEEPKIAELVYSILGACPELVASFWPHSGISVDPRLSAKWLATMALLGHVISLPVPPNDSFHVFTGLTKADGTKETVAKANPPSLQVIIEAILPSPLTKQHLSKGLQHNVGLVQHETALTLARSLQKLLTVKATFAAISREMRLDMGGEQFDDTWSKCLRELEMETRKRVPEVPVIIAFAQKSAASQALQASLEEADEGEKAKANLLTEAALRLFRLYYRALPNMAAEFRFDVGKLLVSSSSAKQEAAARKMAREGSVIDDSGSVASFGTVGSAGMGGGFGQSRGDVTEFDALSQVHVLELLASVREWDWTAKAAGSAYTYVYHILQLRLSTPHLRTVEVTEKLLKEMIGESIMFDHDRQEWALWVDCLPRTRSLEVKTSATLALERLHLLGFIDDCIRRCMKTPYRYIEEVSALASQHQIEVKQSTLPSPLLFTMLEQFQAKLAGHHIASDAAEVIITYLRQIILSMASKQHDFAVIALLEEKLRACLTAAEVKRETPLPTLTAQSELLRAQIATFGGAANPSPATLSVKDVEGEDAAENLRRRIVALVPGKGGVWDALLTSKLERRDLVQILGVTPFAVVIADLTENLDLDVCFDLLRQAYLTGRMHSNQNLRLACLLNRLAGFDGSIALLSQAISFVVTMMHRQKAVDNMDVFRTTRQLFETPVIKRLTLTEDGEIQKRLASAISIAKSAASPILEEVAEEASTRYVQMSLAQQVSHARAIALWIRFLTQERSEQIFKQLTSAPAQNTDMVRLLGKLIRQSKNFGLVVSNLPFILQAKLQLPALDAVQQSGTLRGSRRTVTGEKLEFTSGLSDGLAKLNLQGIKLASLSTASIRLVATCAPACIDGKVTATAALHNVNWTVNSLARLRLLYSEADLDELESARPGFMAFATESALSSDSRDANDFCLTHRQFLVQRAAHDARMVGSIAEMLREDQIVFTAEKIGLLRSLVEVGATTLPAQAVLEAVARWITPRLTREGNLLDDEVRAMSAYEDFAKSNEAEIGGYLVEPLLAAVIQDKLRVLQAVRLAAVLCGKSSIKAMVVRQHLQLLLGTERLNKSMQVDPLTTRRSVARLALALFNSSPYSACQPSFVEPLIRLYKGTTDIADADLLAIFGLYERYKRQSLAKAIVGLWTAELNMAADENEYPLDALKQLDPKIVFATCIAFERKEDQEEEKTVYDPSFVLSLTAACLREGSLTGLQWVEILRSNVLALATCALSSKNRDVRTMASWIMGAAVEMVQTTPFQEQHAVKRLLSLLRHGISSSEEGVIDRVPFMMAFLFAHAFRTIGEPSSYLYPLISAFLLRRPTMDFRDVPMLYDMLYAAGQGSKRERRWMVRFLRDSLRSRSDWQICQRRHTFALLASIYQSSTEYNLRSLIIQSLQAMTAIPEASIHLAEKEGLVEWLEMACLNDQSTGRGATLEDVIGILENVVTALVQRDMSKSSKVFERGRRWHIQVLGCLQRIAPVEDLTILQRVSEMVLRISLTTRAAVAAPILTTLTENTRRLDLKQPGIVESEVWQKTVESLLRSGMSWDPATLSDGERFQAAKSLAVLSCRVAACPGPLGDWVREETLSISAAV